MSVPFLTLPEYVQNGITNYVERTGMIIDVTRPLFVTEDANGVITCLQDEFGDPTMTMNLFNVTDGQRLVDGGEECYPSISREATLSKHWRVSLVDYSTYLPKGV